MPEYLAPGVFVEEVSSGIRPITGVATSTTAFVGMTERGPLGTPVPITSVAEFERVFGGPPNLIYRMEQIGGGTPGQIAATSDTPEIPYGQITVGGDSYALSLTKRRSILHSAVRHYFANGGSKSWIVSAGSHEDDCDSKRLVAALEPLRTLEEPSLLVLPDAARLASRDAAQVHKAMLAHCTDMPNRFAILDLPGGFLDRAQVHNDPVTAFRKDVGTDGLENSAVYYPWLHTTLFHPDDFTFENIEPKSRKLLEQLLADESATQHKRAVTAPKLSGDFTIVAKPGATVTLTPDDFRAVDDSRARDLRFSILDDGRMTGRIVGRRSGKRRFGFRQRGLAKGNIRFIRDKNAVDPGQFDLIVTDADGLSSTQRTVFVVADTSAPEMQTLANRIATEDASVQSETDDLDRLLRKGSPLYGDIMHALSDAANIIPPSAAMAGLYARTDASRGVWKAPAGIPLLNTTGPSVTISDRGQRDLNTPGTGVSVNAIRSFASRGTLAWGARTMAGYDNEWRYVPVRRTALFIKRSLSLGTEWAVFEPNDANTWASIKQSADGFLMGLWRSGALIGQRTHDAFFVKVGLGETMTEADIQNGRLIVEIGVAPVRPAEFVILKFQHKIQSPS